MDGIHDMGGMHGFGKVEPEPNEPVFHAPWEGRTLALNRAMGYTGIWTIDQTRYGIEKLPPDVYLTSSYYQKWAVRLENLVVELGLAGADEIKAGHALRPGKTLKRKLDRRRRAEHACRAARTAARPKPRPASRPATACAPRTSIRQTHTRLPRYARDKVGVVEAIRGCHVFPDTVALGKGDDPQWLYTVLFDGRELWGESSDPTLKVSIEAFEPYLEPA